MSKLAQRIDALAGSTAPFVTYYDPATGERTELSGVTTFNWVAKTANLLVDGYDAEPDETVDLTVPGHWTSVVWLLASWRVGLHVTDAGAPGIAVIGPDSNSSAPTVFALSMRPLGLPFFESPAPAIDFHAEVLSYPDALLVAVDPQDADAALSLNGTTQSHAEVAAHDPDVRRLLTDPDLATLSDAVASALADPSSGVVIVNGGSRDDLDRIARDEQVP